MQKLLFPLLLSLAGRGKKIKPGEKQFVSVMSSAAKHGPLKYTSSQECGRDNWRLIELLLMAAWPIISMEKSALFPFMGMSS